MHSSREIHVSIFFAIIKEEEEEEILEEGVKIIPSCTGGGEPTTERGEPAADGERRTSGNGGGGGGKEENQRQRWREGGEPAAAEGERRTSDIFLDIILNKNEVGISPVESATESRLCFYDVLADHYVRMPQDGKLALDLIIQLWSQSFASHIFALLFHKWLFEVELQNSEVLLRYSSALVQGATNVFWIDIQTNTRRFFSLFYYLLEDVALVTARLNKIPMQAQRDLYLLLSRFLFFYNLDDKLATFLKHFPTFPNAFLMGGPADIFIIEITDQLQKLKVEPVLLHYLSRMRVLQGLELRMTTSTRLKACLYSFTSPGGPMYPTRAVRHAAWDTLDLLFPVGRYPRHLISLFFRLLYPWYWPSSCWNFIMSCISAIMYSLLRLIFTTWENFRRPKYP